jgi:alkylation response protein AidB-like acyl-CoA dehydrogenase
VVAAVVRLFGTREQRARWLTDQGWTWVKRQGAYAFTQPAGQGDKTYDLVTATVMQSERSLRPYRDVVLDQLQPEGESKQ